MIGRPIFAALLLIVILLAGGLTILALAVKQYLDSPLPTLEVSASYPGADAQAVADKVAVPIERELYGVEDMVAMSRQCTDDGAYRLTITFRRGTDLQLARVLVLSRVAIASPQLPDVIKRTGVAVTRQPTR
jgi:multidrug efflux pump subunit AcrB